MNKRGAILPVLAIVVVLAVMLGGYVVSGYNRFVGLNEAINAQWAQVQNQLQRRNDLVPNLVNTVKGYAKHENEIFTHIADARAQLAGARTINDQIKANQEMDSALARLLVVVERYPNLKANENFIRLQDELAGTENRIAVERQRFNESIRQYNVMIRRFPANIVAGITGFGPREGYFQAVPSAAQPPDVQF